MLKMSIFGALLSILLPLAAFALEECKIPRSDLGPGCRCYLLPGDEYYPSLECQNLTSHIPLQKSLRAISELNHSLRTVSISDSLLQMIPGGMFKTLPLWQIKILNTPLLSIDTPDMMTGLEYSLDHIYVSGNRYVSSWDFTATQPLQRLISITIDNCDIFHLLKSYIDKMPDSLSTLYLDNNRIETIEPKAFVDSNINTLSLDKNLIKELPGDALPNSLSILYIRDNLIEAFPLDIFENSKRLRIIYMERNRIHTLDMRAFLYINKHYKEKEDSIEINLRNNPLNCCSFTWIADLEIKEYFVGKCAAPSDLVGLPLQYIDDEVKKFCRQ